MKKILIITILIFFFGISLIHFPLFLEPYNDWSLVIDPSKSSSYGSFLSGYTGTFLLLLNILLLLFVHYEQSKSEFEKTFYSFISIHRENVDRIRYANYIGQEAIEKIMELYDNILDGFIKNGWEGPIERKFDDAYFVIFFGYNTRAFQIVSANFRAIFRDYFSFWTNVLYHTKGVHVIKENDRDTMPGMEKYLSTYFRHLFQFLRFIDESDALTRKQKYTFARILRAQLSTHEQALILVNSLGTIGRQWNRRNFLQKYQLIKNIPKGYFKSFDHQKYVSGIEWEHFEYSHGG